MKHHLVVLLVCGVLAVFGNVPEADGAHRLGGGFHYWKTLDNVDIEGVDEDGFAALISYQYQMIEFLTWDLTVEFSGKGYAGATQSVIIPQAYFLIGRAVYGGVGAGIPYSGGDFAEQPFLAARAGIDLELLPTIFLDINANYRVEHWGFESITGDDIDTDLITVGAVVRIEFGEY